MWALLHRRWHPKPKCLLTYRCRSGWSLIELVVVLVILGMFAATVSVSMRGVWARFQAARVLDTVLDLDDRARQLSVASGRGMELVLQSDGKVALRYLDGRIVKQANLSLPSGLELVCVSRGTTFRREMGFQIPYSTAGTSPVLLLGLASNDGLKGGPEWVAVLAGGQRKKFESRELAERWLRGNE